MRWYEAGVRGGVRSPDGDSAGGQRQERDEPVGATGREKPDQGGKDAGTGSKTEGGREEQPNGPPERWSHERRWADTQRGQDDDHYELPHQQVTERRSRTLLLRGCSSPLGLAVALTQVSGHACRARTSSPA